jgi:prophage DNA circulation protein
MVFQPDIVELSATHYVAEVNLDDASILERALADMQSSVASINGQIQGVVNDVSDAYNDLATVIDSTMDELMLVNPLTILHNVQDLINLPATIADKFDLLKTKYQSIIEDTLDVFPFSYGTSAATKTQCVHAETIVNATLISLAGSAANSEFRSRADIVSAKSLVEDLYTTYQTRLGEYVALFSSGGAFYEPLEQDRYTPGYEALALINRVITDTATALVERSFYLPTEIKITLDRDRTLLDLSFEIYGNIDRIDELISVNAISDPYFLPRGMEIIYYSGGE